MTVVAVETIVGVSAIKRIERICWNAVEAGGPLDKSKRLMYKSNGDILTALKDRLDVWSSR